MARISTYSLDTTLTGGEKVIGTDVGGATLNYSIDNIADFLSTTGAIGIGGQANFKFTTAVVASLASGEVGGGTASGTNFSSITSLVFSKFDQQEKEVLAFLQAQIGENILISQVDDLNAFGVFKITALTQDSTYTNFYTASLTLVSSKSNGAITNGKYYAVSVSPTISEFNFATENELVTVASSTTELDAEANLTFDGTTLAVTGIQTISSTDTAADSLTITNTHSTDQSGNLAGIQPLQITVSDTHTISRTRTSGLFGLTYAKSGVTADTSNHTAQAMQVTMIDTATNHSGSTVDFTGLAINIDHASNTGTIGGKGIYIEALTDGDPGNMYGLLSSVEDGGYELYAYSSANANNYAYWQTTASGATTIATEDSSGTGGTLTLDPDGKLVITPADITGDVFHLDADADTDNITNIDVGVLDIDATATATITTAGLTKFEALGVEIENGGAAPALLIDNNTVDQIALDIDAANTTANVVDIAASSTTGDVIDIVADSLTSGAGLKVYSDSDSVIGDFNLISLHQDNAAAVSNVPFKIDADGARVAARWDHAPALAGSVNGISMTQTTTGTGSGTQVGINLGTNNTTCESGTTTMYGIAADATLQYAADSGTPTVYGIKTTATGGTNGTSTAYGIKAAASGADTNVGAWFQATDGGLDLKITSSADTGDYFSIATTTHGATTITTVDDEATAAHLTLDPDGLLKTTAFGVEIENASATGAPALIIDNDDTDQIALKIEAANIDEDVISITANALTTETVFSAQSSSLTSGGMISVSDSSSDTTARKTVEINQTHASATGAKALSIGSAAGVAVDIDSTVATTNVLDISATSLTTGKALVVDVNAITTGYAAFFDIADSATGNVDKSNGYVGITRVKSGVAGDGNNNLATGLQISLTDSATNHANSAVTQHGLDILVDSASNQGTIENIGIDIEAVTDGDTSSTFGLRTKVEDGGSELHFMSSADTGDYFSVSTTTHGATTIATVDDDAHAADLTFSVDGFTKFTSLDANGGGVEIETGSAAGVPALLIDHNDTDVVALSFEAANIDENVIEIAANALTEANVIDISATALTTGKVFHADVNDAVTAGVTRALMTIDYDKSGVTGDGNTNSTTGIEVSLADAATNHANAVVNLTGINSTLASTNATGTLTSKAGFFSSLGADTNIGLEVKVTDGAGYGYKQVSSANTNDFFGIAVGAEGATTISTVDADSAVGHLTFNVDGNIKFGGTSHTHGIRREVIALNNSSGAVDRTLTAAESGALITIDPSTDNTNTIKITLPTNATGLNYKFVVTADASNTAADVLFTSASASNDFRGHFLATNAGVELVANACAFTLDVSVVNTIGATSWEVVADGTFWAITGFYTGTQAQIGTSGDGLLLTNSTL